MLSEKEKKRYGRQMLISGWGEEGQLRLKESTVFVAGAGGLGSPVSIYLAAAGVGRIVLCDCDSPELSNLNRQILHSEARIGTNKAVSGKLALAEVNPEVEVVAITERIDAANVARLAEGARIVVDCMDNFETRFVLNQHAASARIPMMHGSVSGMEGRATFIACPETPCLRCVFPEGPAAEVFPVVGATPGIIGAVQAMETLKHLTGIGSTLKGRLLVLDGETMSFEEYRTVRLADCPVCGTRTACPSAGRTKTSYVSSARTPSF